MDECQNVIAFDDFDAIDDATEDEDTYNMGQSASKKESKRYQKELKRNTTTQSECKSEETKGTAMLFGFKKKITGTNNKKISKTTNNNNNNNNSINSNNNNNNNSNNYNNNIINAINNNINNNNNNNNNDDVEEDCEKFTINEKQYHSSATIISNPGIDYDIDDNGNTKGSLESLTDEDKEIGRTTPRLAPPKKESSGTGYRSTRFGFRQTNVVRPASVGLTPRIADYDNIINNNTPTTAKKRSKSACNPNRCVTPNKNNNNNNNNNSNRNIPFQHQHQPRENLNPKINLMSTNAADNNNQQQHHHQMKHKIAFEIQSTNTSGQNENLLDKLINFDSETISSSSSSAVHNNNNNNNNNSRLNTNEIVRPTPQLSSASASKYTLHTFSLPKVRFPVPISLSSVSSRPTMDTKIAKHAANTTRRSGISNVVGPGGGIPSGRYEYQQGQLPRNTSVDSGVYSSGDNYNIQHQNKYNNIIKSPKHTNANIINSNINQNHNNNLNNNNNSVNNRPRNLEMVFSGRHKFDVRDLEDSLSDDSVIPLSLPKLPNVFCNVDGNQSDIPLRGLMRTTETQQSFSELITTQSQSQSQQQQQPPPSSSTSTSSVSSSNVLSENLRKISVSSLNNVSDSIEEEEKLLRDNSSSEKNSNNYNFYNSETNREYSPLRKVPIETPSSSSFLSNSATRTSWFNNNNCNNTNNGNGVGGECMAFKDCSSISIDNSSSDSDKLFINNSSSINNNNNSNAPILLLNESLQDDDLSDITMPTNPKSIYSSITLSLQKPKLDITYRDGFTDKKTNECNKRTIFNVDSLKFADIQCEATDSLLDDETSPTDSLFSSSGSSSSNDNSEKNCPNKMDTMAIKRNNNGDGGLTPTNELITKNYKKRINDSIKEKETIDDIIQMIEDTANIDLCSPMSPGTPTHASTSLSLSDDGGRDDFLIDDEIADQPALCFGDGDNNNNNNNNSNDDGMSHSFSQHQLHTPTIETPTVCESINASASMNKYKYNCPLPLSTAVVVAAAANMNSNSYAPKVKPRQSLLSRTESLDTLSPCESICSDDLMMDYECHSSIDSIDRVSKSNHSGSVSALHSLDEQQLLSELGAQGVEIEREYSSLLRVGSRNASRESIMCQLPARATRLLNRSRLQSNQLNSSNIGGCAANSPSGIGSDSPKSLDSIPYGSNSGIGGTVSSPLLRRTQLPRHLTSSITQPTAITTTTPFTSQSNTLSTSHLLLGDTNSNINYSTDDEIMLDKSLRNSLLQDMLYFKKQVLCLRSILQETQTLNPFEINNGQFFGSCLNGNNGYSSSSEGAGEYYLNDYGYNNTNNVERRKNTEAFVRDNSVDGGLVGNDADHIKTTTLNCDKDLVNRFATTTDGQQDDDTKEAFMDLRRQVVYLQSQIDDKNRTIRIQQSVIDKLESDRQKTSDSGNITDGSSSSTGSKIQQVERINSATQTERLRPLSMGPDSRNNEDRRENPLSNINKLVKSTKMQNKQISTTITATTTNNNNNKSSITKIKTPINSTSTSPIPSSSSSSSQMTTKIAFNSSNINNNLNQSKLIKAGRTIPIGQNNIKKPNNIINTTKLNGKIESKLPPSSSPQTQLDDQQPKINNRSSSPSTITIKNSRSPRMIPRLIRQNITTSPSPASSLTIVNKNQTNNNNNHNNNENFDTTNIYNNNNNNNNNSNIDNNNNNINEKCYNLNLDKINNSNQNNFDSAIIIPIN